MKKIKKIIFSTLKLFLTLSLVLTLVLFLYTIFFYDPKYKVEKLKKDELVIKDKTNEIENKKIKEKNEELPKKNIKKNTKIKDGLYATVGTRAITKSDILNEVKMILIINNIKYTQDQQTELQRKAVRSLVARNIKQIEIEKNNFLTFSDNDLIYELSKIAENIGVNLETLKKICESQNLDFALIENETKTKLLWNSLIFHMYKDKLSINLEEIDEQLKSRKNTENIDEFLISEILLKPETRDKLQKQVDDLIKEIEANGFESSAMKSSVSNSSTKGGDLGWLTKNQISKNFISIIENLPIGQVSKPIILKDGILFFKVRDKRTVKMKINLEQLKDQLVNLEKRKILDMYSMTHYDNLKRSIGVNFF